MAPIRVMIVEDNRFMLTSLRALLSRMPELSVVAAARNGAEALPLIQETQPQVLILDIKMPEMNGWELLDELHKINSPVQVIVLTAVSEESSKQLAFDKGVVAYVTKGDASLFLDILQRVIRNLNEKM